MQTFRRGLVGGFRGRVAGVVVAGLAWAAALHFLVHDGGGDGFGRTVPLVTFVALMVAGFALYLWAELARVPQPVRKAPRRSGSVPCILLRTVGEYRSDPVVIEVV